VASSSAESQKPASKGKVLCVTESRYNRSPKLVLNTVNDFNVRQIALWAKGQTITWKYSSDSNFSKISAEHFEDILNKAISAWVFVPFTLVGPKDFRDDVDFIVTIHGMENRQVDEFGNVGYVLGQAFFPDSVDKSFHIWPSPFDDSELLNTVEHELGHTFGLRHYFGLEEGNIAFFRHDPNDPKSIMNYNENGVLTCKDKIDLKDLYNGVWAKTLTRLIDEQTRRQVRIILLKTLISTLSSVVKLPHSTVPVDLSSFVSNGHNTPKVAAGKSIAFESSDIPNRVSAPSGNEKDFFQLGMLIGKLLSQYSKEEVASFVSRALDDH